MDWIKWLIPLIALAVWIIANLVKNRDQDRRPSRTTNRPPSDEGAGEGPRPRRTPAEIDEFLQEVRRRREAADRRKSGRTLEPMPQTPAAVVIETPRPRSTTPRMTIDEAVPVPPPPAPPMPAAPPPLPAMRAEPVFRAEPVLRVEPLPRTRREASSSRQVAMPPTAVPAPTAAPAQAAPPPATVVASTQAAAARRLAVAGAARNLVPWLRSPQNLATAFLLKEIFDRPLSQRRRR